MPSLSKIQAILMAFAVFVAGSAKSACIPDGSGNDLHDCALRQLSLQDDATNKLYERLLEVTSQEEKLKLQAEQTAWLEGRDARCEKLVQRSTKNQSPAETQHTGCLIALSEQRSKLFQQRLVRQPPTPSIERTSPGKPGAASHVKR